jgi:hypothetical protein
MQQQQAKRNLERQMPRASEWPEQQHQQGPSQLHKTLHYKQWLKLWILHSKRST